MYAYFLYTGNDAKKKQGGQVMQMKLKQESKL
jgi:hypothetical protein